MRILIADDEPDLVLLLRDRLVGLGHDISTATDGQEAVEAAGRSRPDLVFLDIEMPRLSGIEALRAIHQRSPDLPVIIMTAHGTIALAVEAMKIGAADFLTKPFDQADLETVMSKALERKRLEGEIARLLGEISHEVKNLMMPVVCGSDLLEGEIADLLARLPDLEMVRANESRHLCSEVIEMLRHAARRIQDRTKDIADYVKMANTPMTLTPCRLGEIAENVVKVLRLPAETRGIALQCVGLDRLPEIQADEMRLYTALYNLVNNAIPEVPAGGSITIQGDAALGGTAVSLAVRDTGRGMAAEARDRFFAGGGASRKVGGTGLGARIIKEAIEAHGGTITIESEPGRGTSFRITLPISTS